MTRTKRMKKIVPGKFGFKIREADVDGISRKTGRHKWIRVGRCNTSMEARELARKKSGKTYKIEKHADVEVY